MSELKFVITGTAGVGKTTAITAISDVAPVCTDTATTDDLAQIKEVTTVAFDFGEVMLEGDVCVRIYGTPGQDRFRHMWEILAEGALGLIILVDNTRPDPISDLSMYIHNFLDLINKTGVAVGVTRSELPSSYTLDHYYNYLEDVGLSCPVLEVDPRQRDDMVNLLDALMATLEYA